MLNIAVNTRLLRPNRLEGIGWFTWESFRRIAANHPEVTFHFFFDDRPSSEFISAPNIVPHVLFPPARRRFLYRLWFNYSVPRKLKKINADLFVSPDGFASLKTEVPQLLVIHDLNFEHYPELLPPRVADFYRTYFPQYAARADRIATVSEFSKKDIARNYAVPAHRIDVIHNGVNPNFHPLTQEEVQEVREERTEGQPYFIYVGSLNPRKNVVRLLRSFEVFKSDTQANHKLMIVGEKMWKGSEEEEVWKAMRFKNDVIFTGRLEENQLGRVIAGAQAMTFVPLFEGFGIPALESFACGVPLITSNTTSLPEVAGDAAILVDPRSISEIVAAMKRVKADETLRSELIAKGRERVKQFSWDNTAEKLWKSIEATLGK